jgi:tripartite-type tricarboxylate transporter receptor subunit TctC
MGLKKPGQSHIIGNVTLTLILVGSASSVAAQSYPDRPLRLIIPVQAGLSTNDTIPRAVGQKLSAALGQPVVMDNRVGASGQIGTRAAATSPPAVHSSTGRFAATANGASDGLNSPRRYVARAGL